MDIPLILLRRFGGIGGNLRKDVDIVVLNTAPALIGYTAIRGKAITINDYRAYLDYLLSTSQEAEDFREFFTDMWKLRERFRDRSK